MKYYSAIGSDGREVLVNTQAEAKAINRDFHQVDVPADKDELRAFLQQLMDAAQAGPAQSPQSDTVETAAPASAVPEPRKPSYTEVSIAIEDAWEKLPLTQKLHFAALAMEDARTAVANA